MEAVEQPQVAEDLRLLLDWYTEADRRRSRRAGTLSVLAHVLVTAALIAVPRQVFQMKEEAHRVTPLVAPPTELTQTTPNRGKISKEFNVESFRPHPPIRMPQSPPSTTRPLSIPKAPPNQPAPLPEPPKIEDASAGPKLPAAAALPPPEIKTEEPKLAFETPGGGNPAGKTQGLGRVAAPSASVGEAMRNVARGGSGGGLVVGDAGVGEGGIGDAINQPPSPGKQGSNLELLSDPMGVDFRPYLLQILSTVRRNWFSVMPESVHRGLRGKVAVQFAIAKDGLVTKVVYATQSGTDALDRAAVASISMSNPFPPLPTEFRGNVIRLQFTFTYNSASRSTIQ
ncbi:MAG TPA: TonB family protein [Bryobacteraceae bacterium]|nr:TonB family protein [Bryobacteraceae bacterium]